MHKVVFRTNSGNKENLFSSGTTVANAARELAINLTGMSMQSNGQTIQPGHVIIADMTINVVKPTVGN